MSDSPSKRILSKFWHRELRIFSMFWQHVSWETLASLATCELSGRCMVCLQYGRWCCLLECDFSYALLGICYWDSDFSSALLGVYCWDSEFSCVAVCCWDSGFNFGWLAAETKWQLYLWRMLLGQSDFSSGWLLLLGQSDFSSFSTVLLAVAATKRLQLCSCWDKALLLLGDLPDFWGLLCRLLFLEPMFFMVKVIYWNTTTDTFKKCYFKATEKKKKKKEI